MSDSLSIGEKTFNMYRAARTVKNSPSDQVAGKAGNLVRTLQSQARYLNCRSL